MAHIDYYFTPLSPFAYLAGDRLEKIAAAHGATITYKPVDMGRVLPEMGGLPLPKRHPARQEYRLQDLPRIAKRNGLKINLHPAHWPTDGTPAALAILAAQEAGGDAGALSRRLAAACWAEEKDIADPAVIAAAARDSGLDQDALNPEAQRPRYEELTAEAARRGVFGVPFYIVGEEKFWGQDRLDHLEDYLAGKL